MLVREVGCLGPSRARPRALGPCPAGCPDSRDLCLLLGSCPAARERREILLLGTAAVCRLSSPFSTLVHFPFFALWSISVMRACRGMVEATEAAKRVGPARVLWEGDHVETVRCLSKAHFFFSQQSPSLFALPPVFLLFHFSHAVSAENCP